MVRTRRPLPPSNGQPRPDRGQWGQVLRFDNKRFDNKSLTSLLTRE